MSCVNNAGKRNGRFHVRKKVEDDVKMDLEYHLLMGPFESLMNECSVVLLVWMKRILLFSVCDECHNHLKMMKMRDVSLIRSEGICLPLFDTCFDQDEMCVCNL